MEQCLKERCSELQGEVISLKSDKSTNGCSKKEDDSNPAEDEGISSSERSLTPDEDLQREPSVYEMYSIDSEAIRIKPETKSALNDDDEETTIDDVIEELKNIINDAETETYKHEHGQGRFKREEREKVRMREGSSVIASRIQMRVDSNVIINDPVFDNEVSTWVANFSTVPR